MQSDSKWSLQSPGFPVEYEPFMYCQWHFIAPPGYNVVFQLQVRKLIYIELFIIEMLSNSVLIKNYFNLKVIQG